MSTHLSSLLTVGLLTVSVAAGAAQHPQMPAGMSHEDHLAQMKKDAELKARGAAAMGFDQDASEHHFLLFDDGGTIDVKAARREDAVTIAAVRSHLQLIARDFANGVFDQPFATHAEVPAGVPALQQLRGSVTYKYEETASGGRVRMTTADPNALAAIHEFLRYQIVEHRTGDPLTPRKR